MSLKSVLHRALRLRNCNYSGEIRTSSQNLRFRTNRQLCCVALSASQQYPDSFAHQHLRIRTITRTFSDSSSAAAAGGKCWNCQATLQAVTDFPPMCPSCNLLQDVETNQVDYYKMLQVDKKKNPYQIDVSVIANRAKELQRQLHPDRYTNRAAKEQELSEKLSSFVNHAFSTLQNPIARGLYLYQQQHGEEFDMEKQLTLDTEFLGDVMELNEKLLELSDKNEWEKFRNENHQQLARLEKRLEAAFENENPDEIKLVLSKMKYYDNLQGKLKEKQFKLGIVL